MLLNNVLINVLFKELVLQLYVSIDMAVDQYHCKVTLLSSSEPFSHHENAAEQSNSEVLL